MTMDRGSGDRGSGREGAASGEGTGGSRFWDEATLVAYVDGELDAAGSRRVEALLAQDAEARNKVALMRRSAEAVKTAYDAAIQEPLPAGLAALLRGGDGEDGRQSSREKLASLRRHPAPPARRKTGWRLMPLAASLLLLGLGFVGGMAWKEMSLNAGLKLAGAANDPAAALYETSLTKLLDQGATGESETYADAAHGIAGRVTLLGDFVAHGGFACREFRHDRTVSGGAPSAESGFACRRIGGGWEVFSMPAAVGG
ncbi:anti-sigma factor family protein [Hypericibacter sp.]|uniref:anti-sigma factor family protein n=1 Tax=Hypericibacter sp. TaxID=2705401 RepID=UPI003D6D461A